MKTKWVAREPSPMPRRTDPADDSEEVRVNVRTTADKRAKWKAYAAENDDVEHLTHLIDRGVTEYITRHQGDLDPHAVRFDSRGTNSGSDVVSEAALDRLDDVGDAVAAINDRVQNMDSRLEAVENEVVDEDGALPQRILEQLPHAKPGTADWQRARRNFPTDGPESIVLSGRAEDIAEHFNIDVSRVERILKQLDEAPVDLRSAEVDGETRWWAPHESVAGNVVEQLEQSSNGSE